MKNLLFVFLLITVCPVWGQTVIPSVTNKIEKEGQLILDKKTTLFAEDLDSSVLSFFRQDVLKGMPFIPSGKEDALCRFILSPDIADEGYLLSVNEKGIEVKAADNRGFLYAIQTMKQLLLPGMEGEQIIIGYVCIKDEPRYPFRSFMLDSGRQYQSVKTIKKYIDMASLLKMNIFHWHLTEGLGWRVEIKKYPLLTQTGAFVGKGKEQQGFYTQEEIKEIIQYAAERNITVIPEIDIPGHAEAALVAYPELGCFGEKISVPQNGFTHHIMCAGKESTLSFLKDVLDEICLLFPSSYIHLGGDEAPKQNWNKCPDCQKKIQKESLGNSGTLQIWFSATIAEYLKEKGRKVIFWEDVIYQDGYLLPDNVVIHWWNFRGHGEDGVRKAIERGHEVICGTNNYTYLNFPLSPWKGYEADRTFDLKDVYLHNPSAKEYDTPLILGMSCALWTDYGVTEKAIDKRLFPRILALAEQMWLGYNVIPFDAFNNEVKRKRAWFEKQGYEFGPDLKIDVPSDYSWD